MILSENKLSVTSHKGYRMVRLFQPCKHHIALSLHICPLGPVSTSIHTCSPALQLPAGMHKGQCAVYTKHGNMERLGDAGSSDEGCAQRDVVL